MGNVQMGCIWSNNKCHTNVSANVGCFLAPSARCDYYQHYVWSESHNRQAHMLNAGLCAPPGDSKSRLKSRLTFYDLVIFIWQYQIATTGPPTHPHMAREWNCDSHTRGEIWAAITHSSYLEKAQKASLLLAVSSLTHWWNPHSISLFPPLSLSVSH